MLCKFVECVDIIIHSIVPLSQVQLKKHHGLGANINEGVVLSTQCINHIDVEFLFINVSMERLN